MPAAAARALCDFLDASPTAFHAADSIAAALRASGAVRLDEREAWKLEAGKTYYVDRNGSSVIVFRPGTALPEDSGFAMAGAHTDAPALRVRPEKALRARRSERIAVEVYGGPIVSTWLDRPLSLAGRVAVRGKDGRAMARLVNLARPVAVVPNLAIHLNREVNKGFEYNAQNHLPALCAWPAEEAADQARAPWALQAVAAELGVEVKDVLGTELFLVDAQRALAFGPDAELVNSGRADDLAGCHAILQAFRQSEPKPHAQVAVFFDNEEVGSATLQGADGIYLRDLLERVSEALGSGGEGFKRALSRSFSVSVDAAQGWHPSYADKYDETYGPVLNGGPAVKANANFRYATDALSEAAFRSLCAEAGVPCQKFQVRADQTPGSTIGPISSKLTGVRTVDVGAPLLAMHSIRETVGGRDHEWMIAAIRKLFERGPDLY